MCRWTPSATGRARLAAGTGHVLAYVTHRTAVVAIHADSGRRVLTTAPAGGVNSLQWGDGGLLVTGPDRLRMLSAAGRTRWTWTPPPGSRLRAAVSAPGGGRIAAVVREGRTSRVLLLSQGRRARVLFAGPGDFAAPRWSPDGRWLLVPWPSAGQWLFLHPGGGSARPHAVANVAEQFSPGESTGARFPSVSGWCCSR